MTAVFWTNEALVDRETIIDYIAQDSVISAVAMDELFCEKIALLANNPELGRIGRVSKTRELVLHKHYVAVYDIRKNTVRILRLLHTARKWPHHTDTSQ